MDKPLTFTVITVSYNNSATIEDTIQSVLSQTYPHVEYLVVDGNSTDDTVSRLKKYGSRITRWISEPDRGIYHAMNKGIRMASGNFIGFLNADDFFADSHVLENLAGTLSRNPQALAAYGDLAYVEESDPGKIVRYWKSGTYEFENFLNGWMPPHPTFYLHKKCFEEFGLFRDEDLVSAADYELMLRMLYKHRIHTVYNPHLMVRMRVGGVSNRNLKNRARANREDQKAWKMNGLKPGILTFILKPIRKIPQFWQRPK